MGRGAYLAATKGGTDRAAARSFSDRAQASYSSQQNNQTGQTNSSPGKSGSGYSTKVVSDGMTQQQIDQIQSQTKAANDAAYQASLKRQADMQKAISMAYGMQGSGDDMKEVSQFHTLSDKDKQFLIDSGFAAAESEGILGGTMGAELVSNQLKKDLADATTEEEYNKALEALDNLHGDYRITDQMASMGLLEHDPSAVYSWSDVESNPFLYKAHQELGSKDLTPNKYTEYMDKIGAFGHMGTAPGGTGGGGWGSGWGSGGGGGGAGGGGGFGYSTHDPMQQGYQRGKVGPGSLQEQVNQIYLGMGNLNAAPGFNKNRGGIISLLGLN